MVKPIITFTSDEQFYKCCKYWQHKLFLDDWFIKFKLTIEKLYLNDELAEGTCEFYFDNKEAIITICNWEHQQPNNIVVNKVVELTVIHELLHLKNEYLINKDITAGR